MNTTEILYIVSQMKCQLSQMNDQISHVEAMHGKKPTVPKEDRPKREMSAGMKAWHEFNKRLDTLLAEKSVQFKRVAEAKQFASHLKKLKTDWTDDEILEQRGTWEPPPTETKVTELPSDAEDAPKKAGRPKMTDEEKAAAKAAREVKKSEEAATPIKKSSKLGSAPGAPKKGLKVAWEETAEVARNLMKEADELLSE